MVGKLLKTLFITLLVTCTLITICPSTIEAKLRSCLTKEEIAFALAVGKGEYAYKVCETLAYKFGCISDGAGREWWRPAGTDAEHEAANWIAEEMIKIGLKNVTLDPFPVHAYHYGGAYVQVVDPVCLDPWLACGYSGLPGTVNNPYVSGYVAEDGSITAEIVYVGLGTRYDYMGKDVNGKLVLVDVSEEEMYWLQYPHYEATLHGAIGMVTTWVEYGLLEGSVVTHDSECALTIPAVSISHKDAECLKKLIKEKGKVKVKVWCNATVDFNGFSYNVYGCIPGTTHPDELIIIGDHYDKHWYGASDDSAGVSRLLGIAKALVDSGYKPSRTIVFIAHGAEEYGWSDTEFDWCIGAWNAIFKQHPEWAGKTIAYFNCEGGGTAGATSVIAIGTPETQSFRRRLLKLFDEWFLNNDPWSRYYRRSIEQTESFPSTWDDRFSYASAGIPTMEVKSFGGEMTEIWDEYYYHTQMDDMNGISAESLAMSIIANGIAIIELDRSVFIPYSFENRAEDMKQFMEKELLTEANINYRRVVRQIDRFQKVAAEVTKLLESSRNYKNARAVNSLLLRTADVLFSELAWVGGYIQSMYPHQHYQDDSWCLREGIEALEEGNIDAALMWLSWTYNMWTGRLVSYETYKAMYIDRWNPDRNDLFWGTGRLAKVIDIWKEYESLMQKKNSGITDYSEEVASLKAKYNIVVDNFRDSINKMLNTLAEATDLLIQVKALLR